MLTIWQTLLAEARKALDVQEVPISAALVYDAQIISIDHNRKETLQTPIAHAEILALDTAARAQGDWRLSGCTLYCTMEPCSMCVGALLQTRIREIFYLIPDAKFGACGSVHALHHAQNGLNHSFAAHCVGDDFPEVRDEYLALLQGFFQELRKKEKA